MKHNLNYFGSIKLFKNAKLVFPPKVNKAMPAFVYSTPSKPSFKQNQSKRLVMFDSKSRYLFYILFLIYML